MRTQPETRARSSQEAGKRALNLRGSKANQACSPGERRGLNAFSYVSSSYNAPWPCVLSYYV